ncbi:MAG TPA: hypothetical protein VFN30_12020 [Chitinophagaceae bacterium]|nr:hypothetical protein [Chitinophagaceae bacterium]
MRYVATIVFAFIIFQLSGQDSVEKGKKIFITGYIKNLEAISFEKNFREHITSNLIHNRVNIKWKLSDNIMLALELRNRLFWGEEIKKTPGFVSFLRNENEKFNASVTWLNKSGIILHTNTERLYLDYRKKNWNCRIGRQRVNWGVTTTWNPNDIFNSYNFLDFDYEERPGSDGVKFQYQHNEFSNTEMVFAHNGNNENTVGAVRYFLNRWNYDLQFITGWYNEHLTIGAGWAGNIKNAGFRGEIQYFVKTQDSTSHLNITTEIDYVFKKGWYVNAGILFNKQGLNKKIDDWGKINLNLSIENLMPTKWNFIAKINKEFTPLLSANFSTVYAPGTNLLILLPGVTYNMATNLDVNLIWQSFFASINSSFEGVNHRCYIRLKWSY